MKKVGVSVPVGEAIANGKMMRIFCKKDNSRKFSGF